RFEMWDRERRASRPAHRGCEDGEREHMHALVAGSLRERSGGAGGDLRFGEAVGMRIEPCPPTLHLGTVGWICGELHEAIESGGLLVAPAEHVKAELDVQKEYAVRFRCEAGRVGE